MTSRLSEMTWTTRCCATSAMLRCGAHLRVCSRAARRCCGSAAALAGVEARAYVGSTAHLCGGVRGTRDARREHRSYPAAVSRAASRQCDGGGLSVRCAVPRFHVRVVGAMDRDNADLDSLRQIVRDVDPVPDEVFA